MLKMSVEKREVRAGRRPRHPAFVYDASRVVFTKVLPLRKVEDKEVEDPENGKVAIVFSGLSNAIAWLEKHDYLPSDPLTQEELWANPQDREAAEQARFEAEVAAAKAAAEAETARLAAEAKRDAEELAAEAEAFIEAGAVEHDTSMLVEIMREGDIEEESEKGPGELV